MSFHRVLSGLTIVLLVLILAGLPSAEGASGTTLRGIVESAGTGLAEYEVSLYARFVGPPEGARVLGRATTGPTGEFEIDYHLPRRGPRRSRCCLFAQRTARRCS